MDVAGVVFRQAPCYSSTAADASDFRQSHSFPTMKKANRKFSDKRQLQCFNGPRMAMKEKEEKKEMKKKMKLVKGLSKRLSSFSDMGFGLNPDNGLDHQVKGQMISEARDLLLGQLQKLKTEKIESKRMKKEEKAKKKAVRIMTECTNSSSSESGCENVMNMIQPKTLVTPSFALIPGQIHVDKNRVNENKNRKEFSNEGCKKIEVCMGAKCKKSGSATLLENFRAAVGGDAVAEVVVVGCKCMGKCKDGPNVRVRNGDLVEANPLCIGVGLEDVDTIVSDLFGGSRRSCSDMIPPLSSV